MRMDEVRQAWNELPLATLDEVLQGRVPLIIAPHPDDESLGCGGLIAQCCAAGIPPHVVILTDGCHSHPGSVTHPPERLRNLREQEARDALLLLGLPHGHSWFMGLMDSDVPSAGPSFQFAARRIAGICENHDCKVIITTWRHDPHCDHEAAATLGEHVAVREGIALLSYPVWGWTLPDDQVVDEPQPRGWRLDISSEIDLKQQAIATHATQYGGVVLDDPEGFTLPDGLLDIFRRPVETFLVS
ncbi:PIG-L deacetylase family protein [Acidisoma cladoniae]|jgi:LmbE family N-acetylglucosaminyl deacetylase|uniref:PIG-L deacetylase family protein n=1 Tax=Acidisoma cladoniae TaxID=3040935 RepID=UPI00254DFC4F|nr:PIG-L deacetylase family protein [Acidisoma sp. PAMC 29798]